MKQQFTVTPNYDKITIKQYLADRQISTTLIKRFKYDGKITANGQPVTVRYVMHTGDEILFVANDKLTSPTPSQNVANLPYRDEYLYITYKPYGVPTHPDLAHKTETLGNMLSATFGKGFALRIITRLDKTTSGLVLGALDEITAQKLNGMQTLHQIRKTYVALTQGVWTEKCGQINLPLSRLDGQNKTVADENGKPSVTQYKVLEERDGVSLVRFVPVTGRTHQIRAHASATGHPIVGDELYGGTQAQRVMLHCAQIEFIHPITGENICVTCNENWQNET